MFKFAYLDQSFLYDKTHGGPVKLRVPYQEMCDELTKNWGEPKENDVDGHFLGNDVFQISGMESNSNGEEFVTAVTFKTREAKTWALLRWA